MEKNPTSSVDMNPSPLLESFRGRRLPMEARPVGYCELIRRFDLRVPLHHEMAATSPKHSRRRENGWSIHPVSARPKEDTVAHLVFALKHEGLVLLTLKEVFHAMDRRDLEQALIAKPTSAYLRRLCFLYEWLLDEELAVPDTKRGSYALLLDPEKQHATRDTSYERRFRILFNLPGTPQFCPLVRRTQAIDDFIAKDFRGRARDIVDSAPPDVIARAAAFLLLSDSKASFAIEGETPSGDRIERWARVIAKAGTLDLSIKEFERLQRELIGDERFVRVGLRDEGGFVGRHDPLQQPRPEHVSANPEDLVSLLNGLVAFNALSRMLGFHPVMTAACIAFGFVYIHPFEDGNGRLHRFLLHHVMAERDYTPEGIVFPVSSAIYHDIARYKATLETVSKPLLEWIEWSATPRGNVQVQNDTADYYRYFDATAHVEYLFRCIETVVSRDLPDELLFLQHRDTFHAEATRVVDMPERMFDMLLTFLHQNQGRLSKRARETEFVALTADEVTRMEAIYRDLFQRPTDDQSDLFRPLRV
ncbi:Fic family protein [Aurantimonas sp. Leaf443]|uniref:Fic family protein n=1 Tax=Aurantimonas sp. Leaf443 TaxID=1736378 RepID=UPI001FCD1681|nr:Fic family protein [Aurantimonas sp. Leaf443]